MSSHRLNILGASGSGATTLGRAIAESLSIPHFDSDDFYHLPVDPPYSQQRDPVSRAALVESELGRWQSWVLSGGVAGWQPAARIEFTLVVFLWIPMELRMERLRARGYARFGPRIRPGGDMHADHESFIEWAAGYDRGDVEGKTRPRHEAYLATQTCPILRLEGAIPLSTALQQVVAHLK